MGAMPRRAVLLLLVAAPVWAQPWPGRVSEVHDGDKITVLRGRAVVRVRLDGIDCPELG